MTPWFSFFIFYIQMKGLAKMPTLSNMSAEMYYFLNVFANSMRKAVFEILTTEDCPEDAIRILDIITNITTKVSGIHAMISSDDRMTKEEKAELLEFIKVQSRPYIAVAPGILSDLYTIQVVIERIFNRVVDACGRDYNKKGITK